jgi:hypothetical protein
MSIIADALQTFVPTPLLNAVGPVEKAAASDLLILGRAGYSVAHNPDDTITLDYQAADPIVHALSCDGSRFASASFQSLGAFSAEHCNKISLPWDLIKLYYAAFYAAHAILRLNVPQQDQGPSSATQPCECFKVRCRTCDDVGNKQVGRSNDLGSCFSARA